MYSFYDKNVLQGIIRILDLIQIQIKFKTEMVSIIWKESIYHVIFNLYLSGIPCFFGHTNKNLLTICCCSNCTILSSVDIRLMTFFLCFIAFSIKIDIWPLSLCIKTFVMITQNLIITFHNDTESS